MAHMSPSAIFSPSIARQQLAAAKDWNYVDNWLSNKFNGKSPPPFERNTDTLKALLALAALNESADEEREIFARLEATALQASKPKEIADQHLEILLPIENSLTREGQASLEALSIMNVALNQPKPDSEKAGRSIIDLRSASHALDQTLDRVTILEKHLDSELGRMNEFIKELQSDVYRPPSDMAKQTSDSQRRVKALAGKMPELKDRIALLSGTDSTSEVTIQDVRDAEGKFRGLMSSVKSLEVQVNGYHGLPQDTDLARLELEGLRAELRSLTRQRDRMFEGLVERESERP